MVWLPEFSTALLPVDRGELTETLRPSISSHNELQEALFAVFSKPRAVFPSQLCEKDRDNETADASQRHDAIAADSISRGTSLPGSNHIVPFLAV